MIKKELENAKRQNNEKINISGERTRMAKVNQFEYKCFTALFFSMLAYALLFVITILLGIDNMLTGFSYPIILIACSLALGVIGRILFDKKFKVKERLKAFSNAKTQAERFQEEVYYQIELEKAKNRNEVIDEVIKVFNSNQSMFGKTFGRYVLNDKNAPQINEEAESKMEELSVFIKEQYDKLDILTTQKVLHDRFWKVRQKFQRRSETIVLSMLCGIFTMFFCAFPTLRKGGTTNIIEPFILLAIGIVCGSVYMLKRNRDYKKVFNNLNSGLGENALEENLDKTFESALEEQKQIEEQIETQIRDISLAEVGLQECRRSYLLGRCNRILDMCDDISNKSKN